MMLQFFHRKSEGMCGNKYTACDFALSKVGNVFWRSHWVCSGDDKYVILRVFLTHRVSPNPMVYQHFPDKTSHFGCPYPIVRHTHFSTDLWSGVYLEEFPFKMVSAPPSRRAFTRWYSLPYPSTLKHGWGIPELNGGWMGQSLSTEDFPASHVWIPVIMSLSYVLQWCKPQS